MMKKQPQILILETSQILTREWRARQDLGDLQTLISSIAESGQLQPISVRPADDGKYQLVSGTRRLSACECLGIPVLATLSTTDNPLDELDQQVAENVVRRDFDRLETGRWLQRRLELYQKAGDGASQDFLNETSEKFGLSEKMIRDNLDIASLPERSLRAIESTADPKRRNARARRELTLVRNRQRLERAAQKPKTPGPVSTASDIRLIRSDVETALWKFQHDSQRFDLAVADPPLSDLHPDRLRHWVSLIGPVLENHGQLLVFCPIEKIGDLEISYSSCGLRYVDTVIWRKTNPGIAGSRQSPYILACEAITWAVPERWNPTLVDQATPDTSDWHVWAVDGRNHYFKGGQARQNILEGPIAKGGELMDGTIKGGLLGQKPEWLIQRLIDRHCPPGGRVLDLFSGTGTVAVCCKRLGINCASVERSSNYHSLAMLRVDAA